MGRNRRLVLRPYVDPLDDRCLLSGMTGTPTGFSPAQVLSAYGLGGLTFTTIHGETVSANGAGETIAIVVAYHDPNLVSDLHTFDAAFGLPDPTLTQMNLAAATNTNDGWASEETLDVEWAHAIAPGANIIVVEAATDTTNDLINAVNTARNIPGVVTVSMSWGSAELPNESSYNSFFTTPVGHTGITFVAASGDTGSEGGAQWPATSPNVLGVGGTSLTINASGGYGNESVWSGSGSGLSIYESEPTYQTRVQSTGRRSVPDVSFLANPNTGVSVYQTNPSDGSGGWQTVGGTSLGAPAWAGIVSIIDQGLALSGKGSLDGATQLIPKLYALLAGNFHTIATTTTTTSNGLHTQSSTYSTTGLGTPNGTTLITSIVHPTVPIVQPITGGTTLGGGTTSGGSTSGAGITTTGGTTTTPPGNNGGWWPYFGGTTTTTGGGTTTKGKGTTNHGKTKTPVGKHHATPRPKSKTTSHSKTTKGVKHAEVHAATHQSVSLALMHGTGSGVAISATIVLNSNDELPSPGLNNQAAFENVPTLFESFERAIQEIANQMF